MSGPLPTFEDGPLIAIRFSSKPGSGRAVFTVRGEVDLATAPELERALDTAIEDGYTDIRVEVSEVTFLDARGLQVLVSAAERLEPDGMLRLLNPSHRVCRVLQITGLDETLTSSTDGQ